MSSGATMVDSVHMLFITSDPAIKETCIMDSEDVNKS